MISRITIGIFFFLPFLISAQTFELKGKVEDTNKEPLIGANIALIQDGENVYQTISDVDGTYLFDNVERGDYRLKITYLGFFNVNEDVNIEDNVTLKTKTMYASPVGLDEVVVEGKVPLATQSGDTTRYNASQYKVLADASTEDLVTKMPGITMENGVISAEGETVQKVLVDGKEFFGNDATAALKNLPAEVVDKIEIFDKKSEQAEFTGFDDGETTKTINVVTKIDKRNGQFGKAYAAIGTEAHYNLGGNFSLFNGDQRISFIGQANDINIQNFSSEDILGVSGAGGGRGRGRGGRGGGDNGFQVSQQGGISATNAFGVNFSDEWGEKTEATFSYFINQNENFSEEYIARQFFDADGEQSGSVYNEENLSTSNNYNHRFSGKFEFKINDNSSFQIRPGVSYQHNNGLSSTLGNTYSFSDPVNNTVNEFDALNKGWNINNSAILRHKFGESRRTLSLSLRNQYSDQQANSNLLSTSQFFNPILETDELDQIAILDNAGWNNSANLAFTNPIGEKSMLSVEYRLSLESDASEKETFDANEAGKYELLNESLTNVFDNDYVTHSGGLSYNYRVGKSMVVAKGSVQYSQLNTEQQYPFEASLNRSYVNFVPFAMWSLNIDRQNNVRVIYRTNTRRPSLTQLQEVVDNSNPVQLSIGNAALDQQFQHSVFARFKRTNTEKGTVMYGLVGGNVTNNYIGNSLYTSQSNSELAQEYNLGQGAQISQPVNLEGYWDFRTFFTYGLPVYFIKSNLNINLSGNFSNTPGLIDDQLNNAQSNTYGAGLSLTSNFSEKLDFRLGSNTSYNSVANDINTRQNSNFLNQRTSISMDWVMPKDIVFRTDFNHQFYKGLSEGYNEDYFIWNLAIGKKIFKNKLGELNVSVYDLLNQNVRVNREVTGNYLEDVRTNVLQRYVMVNFIYNFRNFGEMKAEKKPSRDFGGGRGGRF
ncbi:outer membrane beta-barrel protein [Portibacter lacus]|uniref:Collagen-binding protein n=1 Tax=Portibacter lacus TaxID=1099794 RepID=A0AA37SQI9_9BACT|nr:outer membrane beta-barrel protein [Portibacter lacus]GLR15800.1 collagen-binding protein [Portibacter lacus]